MSMDMPTRGAVIVAVFLATVSRSLLAQATTSAIQGVIRGPDRTAPPSASIEIKSRETGVTRHTAAGADGSYRAFGLSPGLYDVTARALGYHPERRTEVDLVVGETMRVDFSLAASSGVF